MTINLNLNRAAYQPPYEEAKRLGMIEGEIIPLCDSLALIGAIPLSSCHGHCNVRFNPIAELFSYRFSYADWSKPFVMFNASLEMASALNAAIRKEYSLIFNWHVTAHFNSNNYLLWTIEPLDWRIAHQSTWIHKSPRASERMVHFDLQLLAKVVAKLESTFSIK